MLKESGASTDPLVGRTIGGSYVLQEIVGVGGMGRVYRAEQSTLGRTVAIKVIHPHLLGDDQTVARFYTEARASSRLNHPNSVSIIDFGRTDDGILYLAMEFLAGRDLAMIMHEDGPIPFRRSCDILGEVLSALEEAHRNDVVHRDLKPENIILRHMGSGRDLVKVVDFGLATIVGRENTSITKPGLVCGTPDYMPPEQGRGEAVDGRGDLYALGVVLFELLADQLPFEDETPTKVVLRHINDPVPDPRAIAPHRGIPDSLAEIAMRALQKNPDDRFQSAREMAAAIGQAQEGLNARRQDVTECPSCSADNPQTMRFCGSCGTRLEEAPPHRSPSSSQTSFYPLTDDDRALVGRRSVLDEIIAAAEGTGVRSVSLHGEAGIGKTRLLRESGKLLATAGNVVAWSAPHPLGAPVPYLVIRQLLAGLLVIPESELSSVQEDKSLFADPMARAGLAEVISPRGLRGCLGASRSAAVARALRATLDIAIERSGAPRVTMIIDDFDECDVLSQRVLRRLTREEELSLTLLFASHSPVEAETSIEVQGLTLAESERFFSKSTSEDTDPDDDPTARRFLPLFLEQIEALGARSPLDEGLPPRLADAVSQRFDGLDIEARRLLQALAVFGGRADLEDLREVVSIEEIRAADTLTSKGLAALVGGGLEITHPFISRLIEAFMPAEARRKLHLEVQNVISKRDAPLEVVAEHAYRSGETMRALMTLERMGDAGAKRGDHSASILAFRRCLELARREMMETGDDVMDAAIVTFSRKLAWALTNAGDIAHADGVIREVLDLAGPSSLARGRLHIVLGRIAQRRERHRDAMRHFGQALEIVTGEDVGAEIELQLAIGELRLVVGDAAGGANAFRRALELSPGAGLAQTLTQFQVADATLATGDLKRAKQEAESAMTLASSLGDAPALVARGQGLLGVLAKKAGDETEARERFRAAHTFASEAGDVHAAHRWRREI
ncbi:MAG: serine/threonine protein kinase/tetratricopeptide (TPR) repeat protein [Polyangiales bacterium]|jgi:serine/threonine protein kinase/tetratricopeptide (TPR) repeat protein